MPQLTDDVNVCIRGLSARTSPSGAAFLADDCQNYERERRSWAGGVTVESAFAHQAPQYERDVRRALAEAAHEIREPLLSERQIDPHAVTLR